MQKLPRPTLAQKVSAAIYVLSTRPELPGVRTINTLMWPYQVPPLLPRKPAEGNLPEPGPWVLEPDDVRRAAASLLASVHTALLEGLPQPQIEQIWTAQAEYLSEALEPALQDERVPTFHEGALHPPQNIAAWLSAFSGPYHPDQQGT